MWSKNHPNGLRWEEGRNQSQWKDTACKTKSEKTGLKKWVKERWNVKEFASWKCNEESRSNSYSCKSAKITLIPSLCYQRPRLPAGFSLGYLAIGFSSPAPHTTTLCPNRGTLQHSLMITAIKTSQLNVVSTPACECHPFLLYSITLPQQYWFLKCKKQLSWFWLPCINSDKTK